MNFFQHSFSAGEISPTLYGRVDLSKYSTGLRTMRNFYVSRNGGAYNRPGTGYRATVQDSTNLVRLKSFTTQQGYKYLLEFGNFYVRVTDQGIPVNTVPLQVAGYSANGGTTTTTLIMAAAHGWKVGDVITWSVVGQGTTVSNQTSTITAASTYAVSFAFNSSAIGTFSGGIASLQAQRPVTFATPFASTILRQLTFAQDQNTLSIVHQTVYPQTLTYYGRQSWAFDNVSMAPKTPSVTGLIANPNSTGTQVAFWGVTAIDADTFEESYVTTVSSSSFPSTSQPVNLTWVQVANAIEYNVYYGTSASNLGFKTVTYQNGYSDIGTLNVDFTDPPPIPRSFFSAPGTNPTQSFLPSSIGVFQQRRWYGNIGPVPESLPSVIPTVQPAADRIIGSRIGSPTFFALNRPVADDDPISFRLVHKDPQIVRHFMDLGKLVVFTEQGEWVIQGGGSGITPKEINPACVSQNGSGDLVPLQIGNVAIYRQKKGSIVRTFGFQFEIEGYRGDDLTVFSNHLVDKNSIVSWDFQKLPHPIIWMARDDGTMLGLTFVPEQGIIAWHRHDTTNGFIEDVCQSDDRVYLVVRRQINGQSVRYIERLHNRLTTPITSSIYMDASVTTNGTLPAGQTVSLTGGTTWGNGELIQVNAIGFSFTSGQLPAAIHVTGADGTLVRMTNLTYVSATQVTGNPSRVVPLGMRMTSLPTVLAQSTITGLGHLEGQAVSVIGDGFVLSSPNNQNYPTLTVTGGQVTLPLAYGIVHVGLPITADLETLNIDTAQGQSILDKKKAINQVSMWVEETRGLFVGAVPPEGITLSSLQGLDTTLTSFFEPKVRYSEGYSQPNQLLTRVIVQPIGGQWNSHGRVLIRQVDPLPAAIISVAPGGLAPVGM